MNHIDTTTDTIAAIATPPGRGGIAVIRISGSKSLDIASHVMLSGKNPADSPRSMIYSKIGTDATIIDEALVCYMPGPHSYTTEDVVEIQCHGGHAAARAVITLLTQYGARLAKPGEFTRRAFLNGRIDLIQAESVMEIVNAENEEHLHYAERLMDGSFSNRIKSIIDQLKHTMAIFEAAIDFHHHDETIDYTDTTESLNNIVTTLDTMIDSYSSAKRIRNGVTVVIAGSVNVGKSSLFNALLGRKRAIVNKTAGTTRDWLEDKIELDGLPINLIDTAGLRITDDPIETEGVNESKRLLSNADILLYLTDTTDTDNINTTPENNSLTVIKILSKYDTRSSATSLPHSYIPISSKTGHGIDKLLTLIKDHASNIIQQHSQSSIVLIERHKNELTKAREAIYRASLSIDDWSEEIAMIDLNEAVYHIESILGKSIELNILDTIFSHFCIGK